MTLETESPLAACGCCAGIAVHTPGLIDNRPGLSAVAYRIGTHSDFLASMRARLSAADYPALAQLRTRESEDFSIALLDAFATVADVLTFYQERIAGESYLRTALERLSLLEMARLLGYRPKPGAAAETFLVFSLEEAEGAPQSLNLDAGIQVQSVPGPDEKPQVFETIESIEAHKEWNALRPQLTQPHLPKTGSTDCYLAGAALNLKPGDAVLFVGDELIRDGSKKQWEYRVLTSVSVDAVRGITRIAWEKKLGNEAPAKSPQVHAFRRRAAVYGHNAPKWATMPWAFRYSYPKPEGFSDTAAAWPYAKISPVSNAVDLDGLYPQVVPQSWLVLAKPGDVELYRVTAVSEVSRDEFAMSAKVTRAELSGEDYPLFVEEVRNASIAIVNEQLAFVQSPIQAPLFGLVVPLQQRAPTLLRGRPLAFTGKCARLTILADGLELIDLAGTKRSLVPGSALFIHAEPVRIDAGKPTALTPAEVAAALSATGVTLRWRLRDGDGFTGELEAPGDAVAFCPALGEDPFVSEISLIADTPDAIDNTDPDHTIVRLNGALKNCHDRASLTINANVAVATHGETVHQVLGSGDASRTHQSFELKHRPLTFVRAKNEIGAASTLEVRIDDVLAKEVATLFDAGGNDRGYVLRIDDEAKGVVQFGDGRRGARLPTGRENVRAKYRKGLGAAGNVGAGQLSQLLTRPLGLKSVTNPRAATGGSDPEAVVTLRRNLPLGVRTLGRAVSLRDYEDFARNFSGLGKAQAQVLNLRDGPTVFITVSADDGTRPSPDSIVLTDLARELRASGDPFVRVAVRPYEPAFFHVKLRIKTHPDHEAGIVLAAVQSALRAAFSFEARELSQNVARPEVVAVAQQTKGVLAVDVDAFFRDDTGGLEKQLTARPARVDDKGDPIASEMLLLAASPVEMEEMP